MIEGDAASAARRWLRGGHRTWRWNDGSYANKNRYDAVETSDQGLVFFGFDGTDTGATYRDLQSFDHFREYGPCRPLPDEVLTELRRWLEARVGR